MPRRSSTTQKLALEPSAFERFGPGALGVLLVLPAALDDGGYFKRSWPWLAIVFAAAAVVGLLLRGRPRLSRPTLVVGVALAALALLAFVSRAWAVRGTDSLSEAERIGLYLLAFAAIVACVGASGRRGLLAGLVAGLAILVVPSVWNYAYDRSDPNDPYHGAMLSDPLGYPNAIGLLVAIGALLAIGLDLGERDPRLRRGFAAAACVFLVALSLSGSRGALLALMGGAVVLLVLLQSGLRVPLLARAVPVGVVAAVGAAIAQSVDPNLVPLVVIATGIAGAALPFSIPVNWLRVAGIAAVVAAVALVAVQRPSVSSSFRTDYWSAALRSYPHHLVLGGGAGSFPMLWREYRGADLSVRDVHNLYLEMLAELGPLGLGLIMLLVATPLWAAYRRRADPLAAVAAAGFASFALHAAVDWDWEIPAVALVALACAAAVTITPVDH